MSKKLSYASIPNEIKQIANESLGLGVLKSMFSYSHTYHLMIKISDGIFIGFALYHFETSKLANGTRYVTGIIDCVCVAPTYRQGGFGTLLTYGVLRKMAAFGVDRIEIILKAPTPADSDGEPGMPYRGSESLLTALGFRKVRTIEEHYVAKSNRYGYSCKFCGTKPDSCTGVLYSINDRDI